MLFPVYWMINVSFTRDQRHAPGPAAPVPGRTARSTATGRCCSQQLPYLGTSLLVGLGTVLLTLALAAPAGYALAKLRPRGGGALGFVLLIAQMIPGIIMAMGFYAIYLRPRRAQHRARADPGRLHHRRAVRRADLHGVHVRHPRRAAPGRARSTAPDRLRTFWSVVLPVSRNAVVTVSLFAFLWAWSDFVFASTLDGGGDPPADHARHLPLHRQQQPAVERDHGHRRGRRPSPPPCCWSSPSGTSPRASPPAPSRTDPTRTNRTRKGGRHS